MVTRPGKSMRGVYWFKSTRMMDGNDQETKASRLEDGIASRLTTLAFLFVLGFFYSANTLKSVDCLDLVQFVKSFGAGWDSSWWMFSCFPFYCLNWLSRQPSSVQFLAGEPGLQIYVHSHFGWQDLQLPSRRTDLRINPSLNLASRLVLLYLSSAQAQVKTKHFLALVFPQVNNETIWKPVLRLHKKLFLP